MVAEPLGRLGMPAVGTLVSQRLPGAAGSGSVGTCVSTLKGTTNPPQRHKEPHAEHQQSASREG